MKFNINKLADGTVAEKIDQAWGELLQNMQDPNRAYKPKRQMIIKVICEQDEKRETMQTTVLVDTRLTPEGGITTNYATGKDLKTGKAYAQEYKTVDARQIDLDEQLNVDPGTGEILDDDQAINKVIDLRKTREG